MSTEDTSSIPAPEWIAVAIKGFAGPCTDPSPAFIAAAADRVWLTMIAFAELQRSSDDEPLALHLDLPQPHRLVADHQGDAT